MASFINTNMASLNTQRNLSVSQGALATSIQRLSSGLRINGAKDDAAGMAIGSGMQAIIRGQTVAMRNANDAISFSQTAEGAMNNVRDNLQRMRELAVQSANATNSGSDRTALNTEFNQLQLEINRITDGTTFNNISVFGAATLTFQVGAGTAAATEQIAIVNGNMTSTGTSALKIASVTSTNTTGSTVAFTTGADVLTAVDALDAITKIDSALTTVNTITTNQGAYQNRFAAVVSVLQVSNENQTQARSRIMDTDYAAETATMARGQILQQAGMAMLAQANQLPNGVMALMR